MSDSLETLSHRFFTTVGLVAPAGYRTIEVVLDESVQPQFGGRGHLVLAFSPDAARENPRAELLTYGNPLLDVMAEVAIARGNTAHLYLKHRRASTGRTLEKVRAHTRLPGHLLEVGPEQVMLFHHALFRFRVSLMGEERAEVFRDVAVDLHTGWATCRLEEQALRLHASVEPEGGRETRVRLTLREAYGKALEKLHQAMASPVKAHQDALKAACEMERRQVAEHYHGIVARLEASKARKGTNPDKIDDKVRATQADQAHRLLDVERRYQLRLEIALAQLGVVSYPKATVLVRLVQGKQPNAGIAVWDSLVHEGYFATL